MPYQKLIHKINGPAYCQPPEIVEGKAFDFKADSWSFGAILYYLLTGVSHIPKALDL